jgi:hypothetical protein
MPPNYITIPKSEYDTLVREVRRGIVACDAVANLRIKLGALARKLYPILKDDSVIKMIENAEDLCDETSRLRSEFVALERRLKEFDQELTPARPPSSADIKAAFDNSVDFATGKKKPP